MLLRGYADVRALPAEAGSLIVWCAINFSEHRATPESRREKERENFI
jgi:hypothetical protein